METVSLETCIKVLDEMILRHQKLHAHMQKGGSHEDPDVEIDGTEVQAILRLCLDALKRHVPKDSDLLNNWHIEKHEETIRGFTVKGAIGDLMTQRGKLKAALTVAKYSPSGLSDDV